MSFDAQTLPIGIDNLDYDYKPNSNTLNYVKDLSNNNGVLGFKDGVYTNANSTTLPDYDYDVNGNMTKDRNKGTATAPLIVSKYNHMNLPTEIFFSTTKKINYIYNALGTKVQKIVTQGTNQDITDYLGGFQYLKSTPLLLNVPTLQFFPHAEGYVNHNLGVYKYVYNYTDHLGNVRVSYTQNPTAGAAPIIMEENHYYPFGLKHTNYNTTVLKLRGGSVVTGLQGYKYKYQGQERQDELGLNWDSFKWRNYDPAIARFMSVDPLTESYEDYTPYQFASNQPVHAQEVEGLENAHDLNKKVQTRETRTIVRDNIPQTDRRVASTVRSLAAEGAYTGIKSAAVRSEYKATVSKLDVSDSKGRTEAKINARENTPAVVKSIIEAERPTSVEIAKTAGTANKTNATANATAEAFGTAGKGLLVLGVAASAYNIATAENKVEATAVEGGAWAGAIGGGEMLGTLCAAGGPYGAVAGAVVGSIIGGFAGEKAVQGVLNELKNPHPDNLDKMTIICFVAGTKITMSDFSKKNIEDVKVGDLIQTYNTETKTIEIKEVLLPEISNSDSFVEIKFEDGTLNTNTLTHPYYVVKKGWCSYNSKEAIEKYKVKVDDLKEGDYVYKLNNNGTIQNIKIVSIKIIEMKQRTYNLSNVKDNHNFFANGVLVHNRS